MNTNLAQRLIWGVSLALLCVIAATSAGLAQNNKPSGAPTRVAIVNFKKVMEGLAEAKDIELRMHQMRDEFNKQLADIKAKLDKAKADLEMMKGKESTPEFRALVLQALELEANGRAKETILQQRINEQEGTTVRQMFVKLTDAVKRIAERDGWDLVLRDDSDVLPPERVRDRATGLFRSVTGDEARAIIDQRLILTAGTAVDISDVVVTQMNNEYRTGANQR